MACLLYAGRGRRPLHAQFECTYLVPESEYRLTGNYNASLSPNHASKKVKRTASRPSDPRNQHFTTYAQFRSYG
jgi:hypothetical protein